jgi:hypothetical protein
MIKWIWAKLCVAEVDKSDVKVIFPKALLVGGLKGF